MNQAELSGFIVPIVLGFMSGTGSLSGSFYPLSSNPSGYVQSGAFIAQIDLDSAIYQALNYVSQNYYLSSNPSGYLRASDITHVTTSFRVNCTSGAGSQYVAFPFSFTGTPTVSCSFINNLDQNLYYVGASGVNTSGFFVNYSDTISNTGYQLGVIAGL
jgi:hypothetical protein